MCTEDEEYYVSRPFYDNDTHGLFAVLFAAIEVNGLQEKINGQRVENAPALAGN
jgi:hypothetical protein